MNSARWKKIFSWFVKVVVFLISVGAFWLLFEIIKPYLLNFISKFAEDETGEIKNIVSILSALLDLILSTAITKIVEDKLSPPENVPEVFITSRPGNSNNLSGVRRSSNIQQGLYISVGERRPQCRFAYAKIKNTGTSVIVECLINKQRTNITLEPNQERDLTIVIYEPAAGEHRIRTYDFMYRIQDLYGNVYEGKYRMQIDSSLTQATFLPRKKLKRRVFGNALSDM